jgi:hypothetical protein
MSNPAPAASRSPSPARCYPCSPVSPSGVGGLVWADRPIGDFALATVAACAALVTAGGAAVFSHPVAPIAVDSWWARLIHAVVLGGGVGLLAAGVLRIRRSSRRPAS